MHELLLLDHYQNHSYYHHHHCLNHHCHLHEHRFRRCHRHHWNYCWRPRHHYHEDMCLLLLRLRGPLWYVGKDKHIRLAVCLHRRRLLRLRRPLLYVGKNNPKLLAPFLLWIWGPLGAIVALPVLLWAGVLISPSSVLEEDDVKNIHSDALPLRR